MSNGDKCCREKLCRMMGEELLLNGLGLFYKEYFKEIALVGLNRKRKALFKTIPTGTNTIAVEEKF